MAKALYLGASDDQIGFGNGTDPRGILTVGESYEVYDREVHSWHTILHLEGIKGRFNSVFFDEDPEEVRRSIDEWNNDRFKTL